MSDATNTPALTRDDLLDLVQDLVTQACSITPTADGWTLDNMCMSVYEAAFDALAQAGRIESDAVRFARVLPREPAQPCGHPAASVASSDDGNADEAMVAEGERLRAVFLAKATVEPTLESICATHEWIAWRMKKGRDEALLTLAREALTRRREVDALRAERDDDRPLHAYAIAERDALRAEVARLREALAKLVDELRGERERDGASPACVGRLLEVIDAALAATPPAAEAATPTSDEPRWLPATQPLPPVEPARQLNTQPTEAGDAATD